ncbi:maestro heat-like repeat-containing protein family member 6 [Nycticebus coucang]|uniref:maestro heat-like repeat-containing protein family member 6 n=1 Tax=Nycticebus coucang TaxID=9470 RepID=UPI00234CC03D|nr:maestro heat-like repeat-containing protein family member 6 [Nycticebus coucang]
MAHTEGQDFLGVLTQWIKDPDLVMQEVGLRGISNLALHPGNSEVLKSLIPSLRGFLNAEVRVTVQAVKCLRNIIYHWQGEDIKGIFCSICPHLRPLINDARDLVRIVATSALGHMLRGVIKYKPGTTMKRELHKFLLPLLLSIQDNNTEVVKACRGALTEWVKVIDWSSLTHTFQHTTLSDHLQVIEETCKYLTYPGKHQILGELLSQSFIFLKSPQIFLRIASITFIGFTIRKMNMKYVFEEDVQVIRNVLESMNDDPEQSVRALAQNALEEIDANPRSQVLRTPRLSIKGLKGPVRKKHLFKQEKDPQQEETRLLFPVLVNAIRRWQNRRR